MAIVITGIVVLIGIALWLTLCVVDFLELPRIRLRFGTRKMDDNEERTDYDE